MTNKDDRDQVDIFSGRTSDPWNNACLNFTHGKNTWLGYSTGYRRGASILADYVVSQQKYQDTLVFPILFLYRHYIELMLKRIIIKCASINKDKTHFKSHNLKASWDFAKNNIPKCAGEPLPKEFIHTIESIIGQLDDVDRTSDAFRYPSRKNGNPTLPAIKYINIKQLSDEMENISEILEGILTTLDNIIDHNNEYLASITPYCD